MAEGSSNSRLWKLNVRDMAFVTVAHIHEGASKWWRFDDETVTVMPHGPIGEKADHGGAPNPVPSGKKVGMLCTAFLRHIQQLFLHSPYSA